MKLFTTKPYDDNALLSFRRTHIAVVRRLHGSTPHLLVQVRHFRALT